MAEEAEEAKEAEETKEAEPAEGAGEAEGEPGAQGRGVPGRAQGTISGALETGCGEQPSRGLKAETGRRAELLQMLSQHSMALN